MTIRPRSARALRDVRERLRDAAAADHAGAASARESASTAVSEERARLATFLDSIGDDLAGARSIYALDHIGDLAGMHRLAVDDASERQASAVVAAERTSSQLRARTRDLRSADKLLHAIDDSRAKREARAEQLAHDDLSARTTPSEDAP